MSGLFDTGLRLFAAAEEGGAHEAHHGTSFIGLMAYLGLTLLILFGLLQAAKGGFKDQVFRKKPTGWFEQVFLFVEGMCVNIIGPHGRKYTPFILTFWLVIFVSNAVGLFFASTPTADLGFNLGMALISIGYVQWEGIMSHASPLIAKGMNPVSAWFVGFGKHVSHFAGPKLGLAMIPITGMIFVIELISEMIKNVSLSLRLFGNIEGGHRAVEAMNLLGQNIYLPIGFFLLPIKVLTVVVQALIFSLLTCVYISLVTHHEHDDGHGHDAEHGHAPVTA